mmetsp:Transcript_43241/g.119572  ORF Transcript_43241/g.119572 Transcript_43241/m.119572 type:complete len:271 (+) Transcript_43241:60-872(+)
MLRLRSLPISESLLHLRLSPEGRRLSKEDGEVPAHLVHIAFDFRNATRKHVTLSALLGDAFGETLDDESLFALKRFGELQLGVKRRLDLLRGSVRLVFEVRAVILALALVNLANLGQGLVKATSFACKVGPEAAERTLRGVQAFPPQRRKGSVAFAAHVAAKALHEELRPLAALLGLRRPPLPELLRRLLPQPGLCAGYGHACGLAVPPLGRNALHDFAGRGLYLLGPAALFPLDHRQDALLDGAHALQGGFDNALTILLDGLRNCPMER